MDIKLRRNKILELLSEKNYITVDELAQTLNVTNVTIRTDLTALETQELLMRTHGGAMIVDKKSKLRLVSDTILENEEQKKAIAICAASLITDKSTVLIDSGSTTMFLANKLKGKNISVITNSLLVADILKTNASVDLMLLGGSLQRSTMGTIGPLANTSVSSLNVDMFFLGAAAYDKNVITSSNIIESELKRQMIKSAEKVVFIADSSKYGKRALSTVCSWDNIDTFITDSISSSLKNELEDRGIEVIVP